MPPRPLIRIAENGFTLVEMALIIMVCGLFIGAAMPFLSLEDSAAKRQLTMTRQKKIAMAIQLFAERNGYLPCPTAPDAATPGQARNTCTTDALRDGVVPFLDLGLVQSDTMDGYGNPFTYAMSHAVRESVVSVANVEAKCRQLFPLLPAWVFLQNLFDYLSPASSKARFCCQRVPDGNAIRVRVGAAGASVTPTQGAGGASGVFALPILPALLPSSAGNLAYLTYTVVSHGRNGLGAYILGTASRRPLGDATADETENADNDGIYVAKPPTLDIQGVDDDLVIWRTQEQLMAETGAGSCNAP